MKKALKETSQADSDLKPLYASMISESHKIKIALATEVQIIGGDVADGRTTGGKIYRAWMDVKAMFTGHDRHAVLEELRSGGRCRTKSVKQDSPLTHRSAGLSPGYITGTTGYAQGFSLMKIRCLVADQYAYMRAASITRIRRADPHSPIMQGRQPLSTVVPGQSPSYRASPAKNRVSCRGSANTALAAEL